jgi:hypothetical protein
MMRLGQRAREERPHGARCARLEDVGQYARVHQQPFRELQRRDADSCCPESPDCFVDLVWGAHSLRETQAGERLSYTTHLKVVVARQDRHRGIQRLVLEDVAGYLEVSRV